MYMGKEGPSAYMVANGEPLRVGIFLYGEDLVLEFQ